MHYLPFWRHSTDDVLPLLRALEGSAAAQAVARRVALNAFTFAAATFNDDSVFRHWQLVIDRYAELYKGPADPAAAAAAKAAAEAAGQAASRLAQEHDARCGADPASPDCSTSGLNLAQEQMGRLRAEAQQRLPAGGGGGATPAAAAEEAAAAALEAG